MRNSLKGLVWIAGVLLLCQYSLCVWATEIHSVSLDSWYVTEDDIYDFIELYEENPYMSQEECYEFMIERANVHQEEKYNPEIGWSSGYDHDNPFVFTEEGESDFYIFGGVFGGSAIGPPPCLIFNSDFCWLSDKISVSEFIKKYTSVLNCRREVIEFVRTHLSDDDYLGVTLEADKEEGYILCVLLYDEDKAKILESEGIMWKKVETSRQDAYQTLQILWDKQEELKITNCQETEYGYFYITGLLSEEEFEEMTKDININKDNFCYECEKDKAELFGYQDLSGVKDNYLEDITEYLKRQKMLKIYWSEEHFDKMEKFITKMKQKHPKYTIHNLFYLGCLCLDENYYSANRELDDFVTTLGYQKNENNLFDESDYGDPEHLAIKVVLQKYKEIYPLESYEELYETYLKEVDESLIYTQKQKRENEAWHILKADEQIKELLQIQAEKNTNTAILGSVVLFAGVVAMQMIKKRKVTI